MTHKENLAEKEVTTTQLASIIGLTARRIRQLSQDGVLVSSSPGKYILSDAVQAYIGSLARGGMAKEEAEEAKKIERVKAKAEATLKTSKAKIAQAEAKEPVSYTHLRPPRRPPGSLPAGLSAVASAAQLLPYRWNLDALHPRTGSYRTP